MADKLRRCLSCMMPAASCERSDMAGRGKCCDRCNHPAE